MSTIHLEPLLKLAERRAVLTVLRRHPEWTLGHLFNHLEQCGHRAPLLRELTLGELFEEPGLEQITLADHGEPPVDRERLEAAQRLSGARFDERVREVIAAAGRIPVGAAYLRTRVGGPRWKLQASLRRLVDAGEVERDGLTSGTRYQIAGRS